MFRLMSMVQCACKFGRSRALPLLIVVVIGILAVSVQAKDAPGAVVYPGLNYRQQVDCDDPANPIVAENCLPGADDWIVLEDTLLGDIEGFAYPTSVNIGEDVDFFVNTSAASFDIYIYRSGYYAGKGARLVETIKDVPGTVQPECYNAFDTGLTSCSEWASSHTLTTGEDWVSGIYFVKLVQPDTGGEGYMLFVVRDDARDSDILYQQSLFTYHAYNNYGGKSVYTMNSDAPGQCNTVTGAPRGAKVSLFRPYVGSMNFFGNFFNNYFRAEYSMVWWLEAQGYDVTYMTNLDTHRSGKPGAHNELLDHKVFLSVGHDEYWSQEIRDAVTAARDAGVHIGIFSANTAYWRVRLEPDPVTGEPDTVIVTYKTTEGGPDDPTGHPTGTWRDPEGVNDPENGLLGVQYIGDNDTFYFPLRIDAAFTSDPTYRHTGLQDLPPDTYIEVGDQIFGWEWDAVVNNDKTPEGLTVLAETPTYGLFLQDAGSSANADLKLATAQTTRYTAPSGAIVFASGTIQWSWGLGTHGIEVVETDPYIQQITYNVLADMGVQPATPVEGLILDGEDAVLPLEAERIFPADGEAPPEISNVQAVVNDADRSVTITWDTDKEATGQIWFGSSPEHLIDPQVEVERDFKRDHSLTVKFLPLNTTFYYKVVSVDRGWRATISDVGSFETERTSLRTQIGATLGQLNRNAQCWVRGNTPLAAGIGIVAVAVVILIVWRIILFIRRRRRPATT